MKVYGYWTDDEEGTKVLHRTMCPAVKRAHRVFDGSAWVNDAGELQASKYDRTPVVLCRLQVCVAKGAVDFNDHLANCRDHDPDLFFPPPNVWDGYEVARTICADCTVREECLEMALAENLTHGMFGGKSPGERRDILARRRDLANV